MGLDLMSRLKDGPLLIDGAYYLELERRCLGSYATSIPRAVLDYPEGLLQIHREFVNAGAEILEVMAWGVRPMDDPKEEDELHRVAVQLAREAAGPDRFVAGNLSPYIYSGSSPWDPMTKKQKAEASRFFEHRIQQQISQGVDLFLLETFYSVEEIALAFPIIKEAGIPLVACMTYRDVEFTREGLTPADAAKELESLGADIVGVNCQRPWRTMNPLIRQIKKAVSVPLCVQPTAYELESGEAFNRTLSVPHLWTRMEPRVVTRFDMAQYAQEAVALDIALVGSCCGSLPYHVRAMAEAMGKSVALPDENRGYQVGSGS